MDANTIPNDPPDSTTCNLIVYLRDANRQPVVGGTILWRIYGVTGSGEAIPRTGVDSPVSDSIGRIVIVVPRSSTIQLRYDDGAEWVNVEVGDVASMECDDQVYGTLA